MRTLIIEDEKPAADRLKRLISEITPAAEIIERLDTVEDSVNFLKRFSEPDLIFMDIQLADGLSFEIFDQVDIQAPVIFTTAFDQYAIKAFKVNSVDYLLKPIDPKELEAALKKFERRQKDRNNEADYSELIRQMRSTTPIKHKKRFLLKQGTKLIYLEADKVAYFFSQDSSTFLCDTKGSQFIIDLSLDELEEQLNPEKHFRISRSMIVSLNSIEQIEPYLNSRLLLHLKPEFSEEVFVSRKRVKEFKSWLDA